MVKLRHIVPRWLPALLMMSLIFVFSSQPSQNLPDFGLIDRLIKKGGHMVGYGLLALAYWNGLAWDPKKRPLAWLLAVLYAVTDEYHQSFVSGRHPSVWDVVFFDMIGALLSLWAAGAVMRRKRPEGKTGG